MAGIKLVYFDARARAESMRLMLRAAGKDFDDVRVPGEKMAEAKADSPYGVLPYIEYKGKKYGESKAIASFIARECNMIGKTSADAMRVEEVFCLVVDLMESIGKVHFEQDAAKKAEMEKKLAEETLPKTLGFFERLLKDNGSSGYYVGSALTLADVAVFDITDTLMGMNPKVLDKFPLVAKLQKNVESNANIKAYLSTRKPSQF